MLQILLIYLIIINIITFAMYGLDKRKAIRHKWRVPESTLIMAAWIGGAVGAVLGMVVFHHKTLKWKFRVLVPAALVVWAILVIVLLKHTYQYFS